MNVHEKFKVWVKKLNTFGVGEFFYDPLHLYYEDGQEVVRYTTRRLRDGEYGAWLLLLNDAIGKVWWFPATASESVIEKFALTVSITIATAKRFSFSAYTLSELNSGILLLPFSPFEHSWEIVFPFISLRTKPAKYKVKLRVSVGGKYFGVLIPHAELLKFGINGIGRIVSVAKL